MKKIAYITDLHVDEDFPIENGVNPRLNWEIIMTDVKSKQIDEIIFGGDIGELKSNDWFFDSLKEYSDKLKITLGNHDKYEEVIKYYKNNFVANQNELFYSYEDDFLKYIFLDSSSDNISEKQLNWFSNEINTNKKIVLFIHHPILKVNTAVDKLYPLQNRDQLLLALQQKDVTIFCAHYHMLDEQIINNIKQFVTPAVSYQVKKETTEVEIENNSFGYRIITFENDRISSEIISFLQNNCKLDKTR